MKKYISIAILGSLFFASTAFALVEGNKERFKESHNGEIYTIYKWHNNTIHNRYTSGNKEYVDIYNPEGELEGVFIIDKDLERCNMLRTDSIVTVTQMQNDKTGKSLWLMNNSKRTAYCVLVPWSIPE